MICITKHDEIEKNAIYINMNFTISGSKFDIKEFHHRILSAGPVPLNLLETVIDDYISETLMTTAKKTNGPASGSDMLNTAITLLITNIIFIHLYV